MTTILPLYNNTILTTDNYTEIPTNLAAILLIKNVAPLFATFDHIDQPIELKPNQFEDLCKAENTKFYINTQDKVLIPSILLKEDMYIVTVHAKEEYLKITHDAPIRTLQKAYDIAIPFFTIDGFNFYILNIPENKITNDIKSLLDKNTFSYLNHIDTLNQITLT